MSLFKAGADFARAIESLRWKTNRYIATYGVMSHSSHGGQSRCGQTAILTFGATEPDMVNRCAVRAGFVRFLHDHRRSYHQLTFQKKRLLRKENIPMRYWVPSADRSAGRWPGPATWVLYSFRRAWKLQRRPPHSSCHTPSRTSSSDCFCHEHLSLPRCLCHRLRLAHLLIFSIPAVRKFPECRLPLM